MVDTPPQTDTYSTALDIFDRTHPLRVDVDENLKITGTVTTVPSGIQTVAISQIGTNNRVATVVDFALTADTYTAPATGPGYTNEIPHRSFAVQVKGTGATPTDWNVLVEGSLDSINFTPFLTHTQTLGETILWSSANQYACITYRSRVVSLTLGSATNIIVTILATT